MKRLQNFNKIIACILSAIILSFSCATTYVHASGVVTGATTALENAANALVMCFLTGNGVISRSGLGGISGASTNLQASLLSEVQDQLALGNIYEQDGMIYYNAEAMTGLYALLGRTSDSRIVSDFSQYNLYAPEAYSGYVSTTYLQNVNTIVNECKSSGKRYLLGTEVDDSVDDSNVHRVTLRFVAQLLPDDFGFCVIDPNSNNYYYYNKDGSAYGYVVSTYQTSVVWRNGVVYNTVSPTNGNDKRLMLYPYGSSYSVPFYNAFPSYYYDPTTSYVTFHSFIEYYCSDPFIIAKSGVDANAILNQNSGNYYFDNYPTYQISSNTFYNNDWTKIYNSYTTNVSNTYNTEIENNENLTSQDIYDIMDTYVQSIYIGIEDGDTDIAQKVDYINEWLSKIYENTNSLVLGLDDIIDAISDGGSGCLWTQQEIDIVLDKLSRIYTEQVDNDLEIQAALIYLKDKITAIKNTADTVNSTLTSVNSNSGIIVDSLDTELSRLATIMSKLDTIISKMGGAHSVDLPHIDPSLIVDLDDILDSDLLDEVFAPFTLASQLLTTVVPVCYLFTAVAILNTLKAPPMTPTWSVPISLERFGIEEEFVIDLEDFDTLAGFIRTFILISFAIGLCFFSITLIRNILQIIS